MEKHSVEHTYESKAHKDAIRWVARKNFIDEDDLIHSTFVELMESRTNDDSVAGVRRVADKLAKRIKRDRKHGPESEYYHEYSYIDRADDFEAYRQDIDGEYDSPLWEDMH